MKTYLTFKPRMMANGRWAQVIISIWSVPDTIVQQITNYKLFITLRKT